MDIINNLAKGKLSLSLCHGFSMKMIIIKVCHLSSGCHHNNHTLNEKKKVKSLISSYLWTFGRDTKWGHHLNFFFSLFIIKTNGFHVTMGDHRRLWNNIGDTFGCTWVPCVCSHHFLTSYDLLLNRYTAILNLAVFKKRKSETNNGWIGDLITLTFPSIFTKGWLSRLFAKNLERLLDISWTVQRKPVYDRVKFDRIS